MILTNEANIYSIRLGAGIFVTCVTIDVNNTSPCIPAIFLFDKSYEKCMNSHYIKGPFVVKKKTYQIAIICRYQ
jgi:hypothetical protein